MSLPPLTLYFLNKFCNPAQRVQARTRARVCVSVIVWEREGEKARRESRRGNILYPFSCDWYYLSEGVYGTGAIPVVFAVFCFSFVCFYFFLFAVNPQCILPQVGLCFCNLMLYRGKGRGGVTDVENYPWDVTSVNRLLKVFTQMHLRENTK